MIKWMNEKCSPLTYVEKGGVYVAIWMLVCMFCLFYIKGIQEHLEDFTVGLRSLSEFSDCIWELIYGFSFSSVFTVVLCVLRLSSLVCISQLLKQNNRHNMNTRK